MSSEKGCVWKASLKITLVSTVTSNTTRAYAICLDLQEESHFDVDVESGQLGAI